MLVSKYCQVYLAIHYFSYLFKLTSANKQTNKQTITTTTNNKTMKKQNKQTNKNCGSAFIIRTCKNDQDFCHSLK